MEKSFIKRGLKRICYETRCDLKLTMMKMIRLTKSTSATTSRTWLLMKMIRTTASASRTLKRLLPFPFNFKIKSQKRATKTTLIEIEKARRKRMSGRKTCTTRQAYVDERSGESVSGSRRVAYTDSYVEVPVGKIGGKDVVSRKSPTAFN